MAWYGDKCFKQRAVNFLCSEGISNEHSQASKSVNVITTVDKSTVSHWASQISGSE